MTDRHSGNPALRMPLNRCSASAASLYGNRMLAAEKFGRSRRTSTAAALASAIWFSWA
jgi:hypothetical protein